MESPGGVTQQTEMAAKLDAMMLVMFDYLTRRMTATGSNAHAVVNSPGSAKPSRKHCPVPLGDIIRVPTASEGGGGGGGHSKDMPHVVVPSPENAAAVGAVAAKRDVGVARVRET